MVAILRKQTQRAAVGKKSSFRVRGQAVAMENVLQYFKRKKGTPKIGSPAASTPSDVSCRTPSPVHTPRPIGNGTFMDPFLPSPSASSGGGFGAITSQRTHIQPTVDDEDFFAKSYLSERSEIPSSPLSPRSLLVAEQLFFSINTYFDGGFKSRPMKWTLRLPNYASEFGYNCGNAAKFLRSGSAVMFRRELSKATNLVQDLLRAKHPLTLHYFLKVFLYLLRAGYPDIVYYLRAFISKMAAIVIQGKHPWRDICELISQLDTESLEQVLVQCWQCTANTFQNRLGPFTLLALPHHLGFIRHTSTDLLEEERLLRELLAKYEHASDVPVIFTTKIILNLIYNMIAQRKYAEGERLGQIILGRHQDDRCIMGGVGDLVALRYMAVAQYQQHRAKEAEKSLRVALEVVDRHWGMNHPWAIGMMIVLESWLRGWGRQGEADELQAEIHVLVGRDEIDELGTARV